MIIQKQFSLIMPLLLTSFTGYSTPNKIPQTIQVSQVPPPAPDTPLPRGNRKPGGTRNPKDFCPPTPLQITPFIPENPDGNTTSSQPIFWFYIPYTSDQILEARFSLNKKNEDNVYQITLQLPSKAGIIGIPSPSDLKYALQPNQIYHWYLEIKCRSNNTSNIDRYVDGYIQLVTPLPATKTSTQEFWYDSITTLAKSRLKSPSDPKLIDEWTKLLKSEKLDNLAQQPLLGFPTSMQIKE